MNKKKKTAWIWDCQNSHRIVNVKSKDWVCSPVLSSDIIKGESSYTIWNLTATTGVRGGEGDRV